MVITHKLKMNMEEGEVTQRLEMPLGDMSSRQIEMLLFAQQSPWAIPKDVAVMIRYQKPDGTRGEYDTMPDGTPAWSVLDNVLTVSLVPQVLTVSGNVLLYACLYREDKVLHTFAVEISVRAPFGNKIGGRYATSQDYYYVTNVLRGPVMAQPGQLLAVEAVDASGRVTKLDTLDVATLKNEKAVLYAQQTLTDAQKERARGNIGAASQLQMNWVISRVADNAFVLMDRETGEDYALYTEEGKLGMTARDGQGKVTFLTDKDLGAAKEGVVLCTEQTLTDDQKLQARKNIGAASSSATNSLEARLLEGSLSLADQKNNDDQFLYAEAGKLLMKNRSKQNKTVTFLTSDDEQRIVDAAIAALPIYSGEVEEV